MTRALGVDLGEKRIGIALSDPTRTIASPHSVIKRSGNADVDRRAVLSIAREEGATQLVVGLPLTLTGARRAAARAALAEVEALKQLAPDLFIEAFDERLTTAIAQRSLLEGDVRRKDRKQIIDKVAAAVMLQSWLDGQI
ncbi:MAG: Holliday junction resolvase RuvX [Acidimicrobiia bacterium]|nr:Holliday junction resolvase RuvX [Acidimicrobiia bacterium]MBJ7381269.1 Holliday junction resolvase RuvX [Acidimicrobiia bacterium]MBJ7513692.1 Holliday junction resolvase RuvX [Acidimicrobiia bacterium]